MFLQYHQPKKYKRKLWNHQNQKLNTCLEKLSTKPIMWLDYPNLFTAISEHFWNWAIIYPTYIQTKIQWNGATVFQYSQVYWNAILENTFLRFSQCHTILWIIEAETMITHIIWNYFLHCQFMRSTPKYTILSFSQNTPFEKDRQIYQKWKFWNRNKINFHNNTKINILLPFYALTL